MVSHSPAHSVSSTNIADLLERILDKGIVIVGDIKVSLVQVELLSIHIRLLICSVDKAKEIGVDWWSPERVQNTREQHSLLTAFTHLEERLANIEKVLVNESSQ